MRDLLMFTLLAVAALYSVRSAAIGVLVWTLIGTLNPHTGGYAIKSFPVAAVIAGATFLSLMMYPDKQRKFPFTKESALLMAMMLWFSITHFFSRPDEQASEMWDKVMKIDLMLLVALLALRTKTHIEALVWVMVISLAFYGVKGGLFTIETAGNYRVWGPQGTFIEGNNELALALIMMIPLARYLQLRSSNRWLKHALTGVMLLSALSAIGTHSRGALLAIVAMGVVLAWRSPRRASAFAVMAVAAVGLLAFMPEHWFSRMETIGAYEQDQSAMGRINAWWMAFNLACSQVFGGGFNVYTPEFFALYAPNPDAIHAAHSIYFQILGEHGFIGLFLFLAFWISVWRTGTHLRKEGLKREDTRWLADLGSMAQVSLVGYAVGGAFLSLAYFDFPYNVMVALVLARAWMERKGWQEEEALAAAAAAAPSKSQRKPWWHVEWTWGRG